MEWKIADDRPIWMQLSEQIAAQIAAGVYSVGERLRIGTVSKISFVFFT